MATFKNAIRYSIGVTAQNVYSSPSLTTSILLELDVANRTASDVLATVTVVDSSAGNTAYIVKDATIPVGSAIPLIAGQKIVLEAGDTVQVTSSASTSLDVVASVLEGV